MGLAGMCGEMDSSFSVEQKRKINDFCLLRSTSYRTGGVTVFRFSDSIKSSQSLFEPVGFFLPMLQMRNGTDRECLRGLPNVLQGCSGAAGKGKK